MMGHYLYDEVQKAADLVRFGGQKNKHRSGRTSFYERASNTVMDQNTAQSDNLDWSEFYKALDMAG